MNEPTAVADRRVAESGADEWRRASPEAAGNGNIIIGKLLFLLCWVASYSVVRRKNILFVFMMKVGGSRSGGLGPGNSWTMGDVDHIFLWREGGGEGDWVGSCWRAIWTTPAAAWHSKWPRSFTCITSNDTSILPFCGAQERENGRAADWIDWRLAFCCDCKIRLPFLFLLCCQCVSLAA